MEELKEFLIDHPSPAVKTFSTLKKGAVVLIKPILTICGAEVLCAYDMEDKVRAEIRVMTS